MYKKSYLLFALLCACGEPESQTEIIQAAECSFQEQLMFDTCIENGCSAEYSTELSGKDSCNTSGSLSYVKVEGGRECEYSASGNCVVVCDCSASEGFEEELSDEEVRFSFLEEQISSLSSQVSFLAEELRVSQDLNSEMQDEVYSLQDEVYSLQDEISTLEEQIDIISDIDSNLVVSEYTVDCNKINVVNFMPQLRSGGYYFTNYECILVDNIPEGKPPLVQVYQEQNTMYSDWLIYPNNWGYSMYWDLGSKDGGLDYGGGGYKKMHGPGIQYRYDSSLGVIHTASHYVSDSQDTDARNYKVIVISDIEYYAPTPI